MKNLTTLLLLFMTVIAVNAQKAHSSEFQNEGKLEFLEQKDFILSIPMIGNISLKAMSYQFQQAAMAFQVETTGNIADSVAYAETDVPEVILSVSVKEEEHVVMDSLKTEE